MKLTKKSNKKSNFFSLFILSIVFLTSCGGDGEYQNTDSGLNYKFVNQTEGEKAEEGEIYLLNMTYKDANDSTLVSSDDRMGTFPVKFEKATWDEGGMIYEALSMMGKGDSAIFQIPARDFFTKTVRDSIPEGIDKESSLTFYIGVQDIVNEDQFMEFQQQQFEKQQAEMAKAMEAQMATDTVIINNYLEENNIDAKKLESGLYYQVLEPGSGEQADSGDSVTVHYTGTLLNGTKFDSSLDRNDPFTFVLGQGQVIQGWDQGISQLNEGAKARFYIPSPLAYGNRARGPVIQPNSILVFEVELLEVN
jgi:FKBP-type peptidyl-prolyl cis-trans isomerase